ncbi:RNA 2'-phosphotransferase [Gracilibacillus alcaliphilus]|uniref:RNA 2'-phosphotransferase n=1 Tax=Gracilibacillus alcaliphilus TaxID=1401441 RepID=UPI001959A04E|nr:RNA 2'-phosphotransferase [Gracilibacillus alcaliphilus]MBM7677081.1 putative RNA 2'-phosphotransferase [Gracilibacillus alcaliphilus]
MSKQSFHAKLSKEISYALRHAPWEYELELDQEGWVSIQQLLTSLQQSDQWTYVTAEDLQRMIELAEKKRYEINAGKIRAIYGHSVPMKILKKEAQPPKQLYHGSSPLSTISIKEKGLLPMARQYVHLAVDLDTAYSVGKRKNAQPIIWRVDTEKALAEGIKFYRGNEKVWLADEIPYQFLTVYHGT